MISSIFTFQILYSLCTQRFSFALVKCHIFSLFFIISLFLGEIFAPIFEVYSVACTHLFSRIKSPARAGFSVGDEFIPRSPLINEGNV